MIILPRPRREKSEQRDERRVIEINEIILMKYESQFHFYTQIIMKRFLSIDEIFQKRFLIKIILDVTLIDMKLF